VAADPNASTLTEQQPVIENELPAYRAILPMAVISLLLGLLSIFSFADTTFLAAAGLAVVTGWLADRKIRRFSDVWTGQRIAQLGVATGLIFGLSSTTIGLVQSFFRTQEATRFAREYADALKNGSVSKCLWYRTPFEGRAKTDPEKTLDDLKQHARDPQMVEMQAGSLLKLKRRIDSNAAEQVELVEIEQTGVEGLKPYAVARYKLTGPGSTEFPKEQYAAILMKASIEDSGKYNWWVDDIVFPYEPRTHVVKAAPVDDGHGHGGHDH
jgi:hypothetical protein